jgi:plasmid stabilization system protein ParE
MSRYVLSGEALVDLDHIWAYIARDDIEAADRWIERLLDACEILARNPRIGHPHEDITDSSVLLWPVGAYLVIYRILPDHIEIVAVTQGSRDLPAYLRRRS